MGFFHKATIAIKALGELGPRQLAEYAWYRAGLRSGLLKRQTSRALQQALKAPQGLKFQPVLDAPTSDEMAEVLGNDGCAALIGEADEIAAGKVRLFGGEAVTLNLMPEGRLVDWSESERRGSEGDVKFVWEPARCGWATTLGRAYRLTGEERYAEAFWRFFEDFAVGNPPYQGPNWTSGQEVGLRLIALTFAMTLFGGSAHSTPARTQRLAQAMAVHAARIPPTLAYARAQNNNHLLSETLGLYTAGLALPEHPGARGWRKLGWDGFNQALQRQIDEQGIYLQHSANYQRLMLQVALWFNMLAERSEQRLPEETRRKLGLATDWMLKLADPHSGRLPNLGPNDGAYILPLTVCPFDDYRPVLQAVAAAFLSERPFQGGVWDELGLWFRGKGLGDKGRGFVGRGVSPTPLSLNPSSESPHVLKSSHSWAYIRVARFTSRPGHADQLHLDLWWRGINVAQDAGTYLYNGTSPWDNALAHTSVHNTLTVDGLDQMTPAGRFLFLDWAQGQVLSHEKAGDGSWERLTAQHDGYRRLGVVHQRRVSATQAGEWTVEDSLLPAASARTQPGAVTARLHWLLPDWQWDKIETGDPASHGIRLESPYGPVDLLTSVENDAASGGERAWDVQIGKAGQMDYWITNEAGDDDQIAPIPPFSPTWGWVSPTYGVKLPALSVGVRVRGVPPIRLASRFIFPIEEA